MRRLTVEFQRPAITRLSGVEGARLQLRFGQIEARPKLVRLLLHGVR